MSRYIKHELASWGNFPREEVYDFRPDSPAEIAPILKERAVATYISRGLGRSYGDSCLNDAGILLDVRRLDRLIAFDAESGVLRCEAGVTLAQILDVVVPRGWFLPVVPGTRWVSVGGAIASQSTDWTTDSPHPRSTKKDKKGKNARNARARATNL